MALPNSDSTNGTFIRIQIPAPPIAPEEALGSANIKNVGIIDISTMEKQIQPLENVVSSACSSLLMSKHHCKSEKEKRKKKHKERGNKGTDTRTKIKNVMRNRKLKAQSTSRPGA
jgi:hypothetical protein